ncbi:MAG TPA: hypothetical protein VF442_09555, partial [Sphingobium sp.]
MAEFVRVAHDINRLHAAGFDQKGCRLQHPVRFARHKTGQAIHKRLPDQFRMAVPQTENRGKPAYDLDGAVEDTACGGAFAATVGME